MAKPRVYITRPLPQPAMRILEGAVEYRLWDREDEPVPRENLLREVVDVDGGICLITEKMDAEVIDRMRRSTVIAQVAVGIDNIDVAAATRRGIFVTNTPGVLTETTADMGWAILMATARRVVEGDKFTRSGRWKTWELMGFTGQDVHGATLVNIGRGPIGDQRALYRALVDRKIWAAGLDVFEAEPVPMDEPLLKLDNVVVPPHLGSASTATRIKMATMAAQNCLAGVSGRVPPNVVNPE